MCRKPSVRNRKPNNEGFTLIELLVTALIVAVILIPFMGSFVTAARTNRRAKRVLEATTAGQNAFEELKSRSVADFMSAASKVDTGETDAEGKPIYALSADFTRTVNGRSFQLKVTLNPKEYTTVGGSSGAGTDYNSSLWAQMSSLSQANNAFLLMKTGDELNAAAEIEAQLPPDSGVGADAVRNALRRDITVTVSHAESTGLSVVKASVLYTYTHAGKDYTYLAMNAQELYNNGTELSNTLSNVFVCYTPMYNNSGRTSPTETVTFQNTGNYPVGLYLVRQDATANAWQKSRYSLGVKIEEGPRNLNDKDADGNRVCVTPLATNLTYDRVTPAGSELQLQYSGNSLSPGVTAADVLDLTAGVGGLERGKAGLRIYDVKIEVYDANAGGNNELLTTLEGTKIE